MKKIIKKRKPFKKSEPSVEEFMKTPFMDEIRKGNKSLWAKTDYGFDWSGNLISYDKPKRDWYFIIETLSMWFMIGAFPLALIYILYLWWGILVK